MIDDPRRAAIVAIGDELVSGACVDTNSAAIAERLWPLGIEPARFVVAGDDEPRLERLFRELCAEFQVVIATGGLGPTPDDVTRHAAARAAGLSLLPDPEVAERLEDYWRDRGTAMPESNVRQALFPQGAQIMPNARGTAPGFRVWIDGGVLACLPGPPREMLPMLEGDLLPWLERTCGVIGARRARELYLFGLSESGFAEEAGDWMDREARPQMGVCAHEGVLTVRLRAQTARVEEAERLLETRAAAVRERFGRHVFSETEPDLARVVGAELCQRGITIALAESCTGGLVAARLTAVPGISAVFREGWVTYSNEAKTRRLGVPAEVLESHGAVSAETAAAMAAGAARESGARIALAVTGIAGPGGGTPEKPVGLVWFGLVVDGAVRTRERRFPFRDRAFVRVLAANTALDLLRRALLDRPAGEPAG